MSKNVSSSVKRFIASKLDDASEYLRPAHETPWDSIISFLGVIGIAILTYFTISWVAKTNGNRFSPWRFAIQALASVCTGVAIIWITFYIVSFDVLKLTSVIAFGLGCLRLIYFPKRKSYCPFCHHKNRLPWRVCCNCKAFNPDCVDWQCSANHPNSGITLECPQCGEPSPNRNPDGSPIATYPKWYMDRLKSNASQTAPPLPTMVCPRCRKTIPKGPHCIECGQFLLPPDPNDEEV